jgi:hypothetical protein
LSGCFGSSCVLEGALSFFFFFLFFFFFFFFYIFYKIFITYKKKMKCLGFRLGASYKATSICNGIIEKMEHRLAGWEKKII